jgi:ADP-ribosylglycohydrolase
MTTYAGIRLKPDVLMETGLPDIVYVVSLEDLDRSLGASGKVAFSTLWEALKKQGRDDEVTARALARLAELARDDPLSPACYAWPKQKTQKRTAKGRFLGCLLGGAVGDALGAPVEFLKREEILRRFGPKGLTGYAPAYGGLGRITDDTQMTLFTAEAALRIWMASMIQENLEDTLPIIARAYLRWLRTQGEYPDKELEAGDYENGWLIKVRELHSRRAPGTTCLNALKSMKTIGEYPKNDSKGCGAVMRVAPVGLFFWHFIKYQPLGSTFEAALKCAGLTHMHPTGFLTAGVLAVMVMALVDGATVREALAAGQICLKRKSGHEETMRALDKAVELAESSLSPPEAIAKLGEGWVAEEALAISVYCALKAKTFKEGVLMAVNHDGDSDSTGSITGNLLGACWGWKAIPKPWLEQLELKEVITQVAEDLFDFREWKVDPRNIPPEKMWEAVQIMARYPGC